MTTSTAIEFTAKPTASDVLWTTMAMTRQSTFAMAFGGFLVTMGGMGVLVFPDPFQLFTVLVGVGVMTGAIAVPFVWFAVRRRPDLALAELRVRADAQQLSVVGMSATTTQAWSVYRRARQTQHAFLLDTGMGQQVMIAKRGVGADAIGRFETLLAQVGLLRDDEGASARRMAALAVGVVAGISFYLLMPVLL